MAITITAPDLALTSSVSNLLYGFNQANLDITSRVNNPGVVRAQYVLTTSTSIPHPTTARVDVVTGTKGPLSGRRSKPAFGITVPILVVNSVSGAEEWSYMSALLTMDLPQFHDISTTDLNKLVGGPQSLMSTTVTAGVPDLANLLAARIGRVPAW